LPQMTRFCIVGRKFNDSENTLYLAKDESVVCIKSF